jgi:hypothetical protein
MPYLKDKIMLSMSDKMRYTTGPKTLPYGNPTSVFLKAVISSLNLA